MEQLKVATINLHNHAGQWRKRRHLLVSQLLEAAPDLISLQELYFPIRQGQWLRNQINLRLAQSGKRPYRLLLSRRRHLIKGYYEGIGLLTRLPVRYKDTLNLGYGGWVALRINIELPSRQTMDFVSVQLHCHAQSDEIRNEQVLHLMGWLHQQGHVPLQVVAGDFNEIPGGLAVQRMKQRFRSVYELAHGREPLATFPTALRLLSTDQSGVETLPAAKCLDYIFVSPAIEVKEAALFCDKHSAEDTYLYPSDHVGILATIQWAF